MMKHKRIPQKIRLQVYNKYNGHCAYCGCRLEYKDMQVDHIESVYAHNGGDTLANYMPSCRQCNFYKSTFSLEDYRKRLQTVNIRLRKQFLYNLAIKYRMVTEHNEPIRFYFEKMEENK